MVRFLKLQLQKPLLLKIGGIFLILIFGVLLYKIYIPRVNAFGCFDDCFNFMGGYFLLHGKKLFSQIFFNHNPGMAYLSALIQWVSHPQNLYDLVLKHRQFVLAFGLLMNILLFLRFGYRTMIFIIFYELSKFYIFGDRFLAEGIIVYPIVYVACLLWEKIQDRKIYKFDYILGGLFVWFVVFMREPYVPLILVMYGILLWNKSDLKYKGWSATIFIVLSFVSVFYHNVSEFFFNVYTTNVGVTFAYENGATGVFGPDIWKAFSYPLILFFGGDWGFFRYIILGADIVFLTLIALTVWKKKWKEVLLVIFLLGLANFRLITPGLEFYAAFHLIVWYGLFLMFSGLMLFENFEADRKKFYVLLICYLLILGALLLSSSSFIRQKDDTSQEFINNYGDVMGTGEAVKAISTPKDTLFLDGTDDIIYWVSDRYSDYQYSWYTSVMPYFPKYTSARIAMFKNDPPDFYYGTCFGGEDPNRTLPNFVIKQYVRLDKNNKPSCLWVKRTKLKEISAAQWSKAASYLYTLPKTSSAAN